ncbi:MAG: ABC transporter ATP-binding protein [Clostridium butyricum]|nr:ABC transporter ATP-binding protein [Clostridium butyricum]
MNSVISIRNLRKSYGEKKAVNGISFDVYEGEVLGLLGPNGAGKSTTISILASILKADGGEVKILGYDLNKDTKQIKKQLGIVPQDLAIYEDISAIKNVKFFASLYDISGEKLQQNVKEALESVALYEKKDDKPKTFSGGMKRRLNIACGIAHKPKIIIMDEPTVGIDPQSRNHILEFIKVLKKKGITVIYSTHYMEEVEAISDRIIIMNEGKVIAEGTKEELKAKVDDQVTYSFKVSNLDNLSKDKFNGVSGIKKINKLEDKIEVTISKLSDNINDVIKVITSNGCKIENMSRDEASLETVFLDLTGRKLRD